MVKFKEEEYPLEIDRAEAANFNDWEYKHFYSKEEEVNLLAKQTQMACDLALFKSDFISDYDYIKYAILKSTQLKNRENG